MTFFITNGLRTILQTVVNFKPNILNFGVIEEFASSLTLGASELVDVRASFPDIHLSERKK